MNNIETMKLALEALDSDNPDIQLRAAIALRQAIEQAQQAEPDRGVYWKCVRCQYAHIEDECPHCGFNTRAEFKFPPPRQPLTEWQPIEIAPKDGTDVLVMYIHIDTQVVHNGFWMGAEDTDEESDIGWWSYEHSEVSRIKLDDWMTPTHWMPLPSIKGEA
jgi:hypothetical protein